METPLTAWEAKERVGLLATETEAWCDKRLIAEDPSTTADVLARFADEALEARKQARFRKSPRSIQQSDVWRQGDLLLETLAGHPNTPPHIFRRLVGITLLSTRAFCRNPIIPFLLLEQPNFLSEFGLFILAELFSEADFPLLFLRMIAEGNVTRVRTVQEAARLHVALAGEVSTADAWRRHVTGYWQAECASASQPPEDMYDKQWYADLVEMELAATWANGNVEPPAPELALCPPDSVDAIVDEWLRFEHAPGSDEEAALLNHIGKRVENKEVVARGLRENAAPADMIELLQAPGAGTTLLCRAILRHPLVTTDVIQAIPGFGDERQQQLKAIHPQTPTELVTHLCESEYPVVRRLARRHPNALADSVAVSRAAFLDQVRNHRGEGPPEFGMFVACLHGTTKPIHVHAAAQSGCWTYRLGGALQAAVTNVPLLGDLYERTGRELLEHLSRDGNRLVRWAAQTRLADPDFVFPF